MRSVTLSPKIVAALDAGAHWLRTAIGRMIAGSASLIALAIFLWPNKNWRVDPEKLFAFLIALGSWFFSLSPERTPSKHDIQLFAKFQTNMTPTSVTWLRRHDFGGSFDGGRAQPLFEIDGEWEGAAYTFDDPVLRVSFELLVERICTFAHLVANNTWPIRGERRQTAVPDGEASFEDRRVVERVRKLNDAATSLANEIDIFVMSARRRLNQT